MRSAAENPATDSSQFVLRGFPDQGARHAHGAGRDHPDDRKNLGCGHGPHHGKHHGQDPLPARTEETLYPHRKHCGAHHLCADVAEGDVAVRHDDVSVLRRDVLSVQHRLHHFRRPLRRAAAGYDGRLHDAGEVFQHAHGLVDAGRHGLRPGADADDQGQPEPRPVSALRPSPASRSFSEPGSGRKSRSAAP